MRRTRSRERSCQRRKETFERQRIPIPEGFQVEAFAGLQDAARAQGFEEVIHTGRRALEVLVGDDFDGHDILQHVFGVGQFQRHQVGVQKHQGKIEFVRMTEQVGRAGVEILAGLIINVVEMILCINDVFRGHVARGEIVIVTLKNRF